MHKVTIDDCAALSRENTRGYWLELKEVQSANVICRVIDLSEYNLLLVSYCISLVMLNFPFSLDEN